MTKPEDGSAPAAEPVKDEEESVVEDVSIATDSELERVISSAAAAVEEFSAHMGGAEESSEGSDNIFIPRDKKQGTYFVFSWFPPGLEKLEGIFQSGKSRGNFSVCELSLAPQIKTQLS